MEKTMFKSGVSQKQNYGGEVSCENKNYVGEPNNEGHCGVPGSRVKFVDPTMCNSPIPIPEELLEAYQEWLKEHNLDKVKDYNNEQKEFIENMEKEQIKMVNGETKQGDMTLKGTPENSPLLKNTLIGLFECVKCNEKLASKIMYKTMLLGGEQFVGGPETDEQTPFVSYLDSLEILKLKIISNNIMLENILIEITQIL